MPVIDVVEVPCAHADVLVVITIAVIAHIRIKNLTIDKLLASIGIKTIGFGLVLGEAGCYRKDTSR